LLCGLSRVGHAAHLIYPLLKPATSATLGLAHSAAGPPPVAGPGI